MATAIICCGGGTPRAKTQPSTRNLEAKCANTPGLKTSKYCTTSEHFKQTQYFDSHKNLLLAPLPFKSKDLFGAKTT